MMKMNKHGEWSGKIHGKLPQSEKVSESEAEKNLAGWKRAMADYDNLHKRLSEDVTKARFGGVEETLRTFLPVIDYFDAALASIPQDISKNEWVIGVGHIQRAFLDALKTLGVETIDQENIPFDPKIHDAVEYVSESQTAPGNVCNILSKGYRLNDKVLRAARVKVSGKNNNKQEFQSLAAEDELANASDA